MAAVKVWNGSAFVDGQPRIWNGTAFVAPSACHVWNGGAFVKVWPTFPRQRMNKDGTWNGWAGQATTWAAVTGWVSDPLYPVVIVSNQLQVAGADASPIVTLTATVVGAAPLGGTFEARLMRGSTQLGAIAAVGAGAQTIVWSGAVGTGDLLRIEARGGSAGGGSAMGHTVTGGSIEVAA